MTDLSSLALATGTEAAAWKLASTRMDFRLLTAPLVRLRGIAMGADVVYVAPLEGHRQAVLVSNASPTAEVRLLVVDRHEVTDVRWDAFRHRPAVYATLGDGHYARFVEAPDARKLLLGLADEARKAIGGAFTWPGSKGAHPGM